VLLAAAALTQVVERLSRYGEGKATFGSSLPRVGPASPARELVSSPTGFHVASQPWSLPCPADASCQPTSALRGDFTRLLPRSDPVHEEIEISYDARLYGITTDQLRLRNQDAEICNAWSVLPGNEPLSRWYTCKEAVRWGLSERAYEERQERVNAECRPHVDEIKLLESIPRRDRLDHSVQLRWERCRRKIMLSQ
jgi:hypothetical protein